MAESAVFSLACKILSTIASPAFEKTYRKGLSIWKARDELVKLQVTIETIQAVLLDAERKQEGSAAVKNWIKRLKSVLYDADDLFDEVATGDLLKQQMMEGNNKLSLKKQVRVLCSKLNPIVSRNSIAKKVKAIRKSLLGISIDMAQFEFVRCQHEEPMFDMRRGQDPGCFVDAKAVIGRDEDKKIILEMLKESYDANPDGPIVIAIVGIGGMGKTTLAQLMYNDEEVNKNFEKMWFSCISDISGEREVLGKILQSICGESCTSFSVSELQIRIRDSIEGKKYFLVLDDVWDHHRGRWQNRMSLLSGGAKGSRIIVTTRLPSVVKAVGAARVHNLKGLSEDDSWHLFKRLAFVPGYEKDPRRESLGREILKRCRHVPLAIWSIGSLLFEKNTIIEWEAIKRESLPVLKDETMSVLKLSYDHLPSNLKQCFAYCSLFDKDYWFKKQKLVYFWIAQGYTEPENGESDFMHLLNRGFFQEATKDDLGEIRSCKMHDIMHDLALYVAGEESIVLSSISSDTSPCTRHVRVVDCERDESWAIPTPVLNVKWLRSCLLSSIIRNPVRSPTNLDKLFTNFKLLRTLSLQGLRMKNIPPSIGELKLLRYLDLSSNDFEELPDSMANLVSLLALELMWCTKLRLFPRNFRKLINLRYLNTEGCDELKLMPVGIGELTRLQHLSRFIVGKESELDVLAGLLQKLSGNLSIEFRQGTEDDDEEDWNGDECKWQLPVSLHKLEIRGYPGIRIPGWGNNVIERTSNLARLELLWCKKVQHLPPLRCLPNLRWLHLYGLSELEFVEEENENIDNNAGSIFFPRLEELELQILPKLKGWCRKVQPPQLALLSWLLIECCPNLELKSLPLCRNLRRLHLDEVGNNAPWVIPQQLPSTIFCSSTCPPLEQVSIIGCKWLFSLQDEALSSLRQLKIMRCGGLKSLHLASPQLQTIQITRCVELMSIALVEAPTPSLRVLKLIGCSKLKILNIDSPLNALEKLTVMYCPELELWESQHQRWMQLHWGSLSNLRTLYISPFPPPEKLPHCLLHRQALGLLQITQLEKDFTSLGFSRVR